MLSSSARQTKTTDLLRLMRVDKQSHVELLTDHWDYDSSRRKKQRGKLERSRQRIVNGLTGDRNFKDSHTSERLITNVVTVQGSQQLEQWVGADNRSRECAKCFTAAVCV